MFLDSVEGTRQVRAPQRAEEIQWFINVARDLHALMPKDESINEDLPSTAVLFKFVATLEEDAKDKLRRDVAKSRLTETTAWAIQMAIIAVFIVGFEFPPCRLQFLKSAMHPDKVTVGCCKKKSCTSPLTCKGNRFEVFTEGGAQRVRVIFPHHKNTKRGFKTIRFVIPLGTLTELLLVHISRGSPLLMSGREETTTTHMFVSHGRNPFTDQSLGHYFKLRVLKDAPFIPFAPMLARRIFIQAYSGVYGPDPEMWDGASVVSH